MTGPTISVIGIAALIVAGLALDITARRRPRVATAAQALSACMRTTPGRALVLATWLWLGVHFLAR